MGVNKRSGEPAVPADYEALITAEQALALSQLQGFGWSLYILRRPKFEPVEIIVQHNSGKFASLTDCGELAHQPQPRLRRDTIPDYHGDTGPDPWANATDDAALPVFDAPGNAAPATVNKEPVPRQAANGTRSSKIVLV